MNNVSINKILKFVDWKPFFEAWELYGNYPDIFEDEVVGSAAKELWRDAQNDKKNNRKKLTTPKCVFGFWPANSEGDDVIIYDSEKEIKF